MRTAIISDIHGNCLALNTVLDRLEPEGIDRLVCLGDTIADGPQPREVLARLRSLGCPVVRGNMDDWMLAPHQPEASGPDRPKIGDIQHWGADQLQSEDIEFLRSLPLATEVSLDAGSHLLAVHGSPGSNTVGIRPDSSSEDLGRILGDVDHAVVASGHTHHQMTRRFEEKTLVNPGSVGWPGPRVPGGRRPCWAEYAVLDWDGAESSVDLRRLKVDTTRLRAAAHDSGMPHAEWWTGLWQEER